MRITFVHISDQVHYEPETAQLSGVLKDRNWIPWHIRTDFSTDRDSFLAVVRRQESVAVAFRVTHQTREIVEHLSAAVGEQPEQPVVFFYGPLCRSHPEEVAALLDRAVVLTGDGAVGLEEIASVWPAGPFPMQPPKGCWYAHGGEVVRGEDSGPCDLNEIPKPDLTVFGGDRIFKRGIGSSLFGELKVLPFFAGMGSPSGDSFNETLAGFSNPTAYEPRLIDIAEVIFRFRALGPRVRHFEFWDRECGWDLDHFSQLLPLLEKRQRKKTYSLRVLAETFQPELLDVVNPERCRRVITEFDAATEELHAKLPGSQSPSAVAAVVEATRAKGIDPALLISVGLPHETRADVEAKIAFVREHEVKRVRFAPFEPRFGHPIHDVVREAGLFEGRGDDWNREVFQPLVQDSLPAEDWHHCSQAALNLVAELQLNHPARFEPGLD